MAQRLRTAASTTRRSPDRAPLLCYMRSVLSSHLSFSYCSLLALSHAWRSLNTCLRERRKIKVIHVTLETGLVAQMLPTQPQTERMSKGLQRRGNE
ncbi:hypothetical protein AB1N83_009223 [Pleurotus pulmonarius]